MSLVARQWQRGNDLLLNNYSHEEFSAAKEIIEAVLACNVCGKKIAGHIEREAYSCCMCQKLNQRNLLNTLNWMEEIVPFPH